MGYRGKLAGLNAHLDRRLRGLGDYVDASGNWVSTASDSSGSIALAPMNPTTYFPPSSSSSSSGSSLTPTEAALISQGITTAGVVGRQAIVGSPTLTYNPATGQYTASGGATLPVGSIAASSALSTLFSPTVLLLGGALLLVITLAGRR